MLNRRLFIEGLWACLFSKGGQTFALKLDSAPFPAPGKKYKDNRVYVYVPAGFRPTDGKVAMIVHFHGHQTRAAPAMAEHELIEQLDESARNAILVVPQLADRARDSFAGKLERPGGLARLLREVLNHPDVGLSRAAVGTVVVSAHSGGFQAAARALDRGGVSVHQVLLLDALYGFSRTFATWLANDPGRTLTSWSTGQKIVEKWTGKLQKALTAKRVPRAQYRLIPSAATHARVPLEGRPVAVALRAGPLPSL